MNWFVDNIGAVHPRVCGEQRFLRSCTKQNNGSSPRVRGTERNRVPQIRVARFIPACAGNSLYS